MTSLITLGINHETAPIALRERVAFAASELGAALHELKQHVAGVDACLILSTCNRTEFYLIVLDEQFERVTEQFIQWWSEYKQIRRHELNPHLYSYQSYRAVLHLMRVASGLDSLLVGEPQILGQIKQAYTVAKAQHCMNTELERLLQRVFYTAKRVRTQSDIGANSVSVAFATCGLARRYFHSLAEKTILLVGAGEMIELIALYLSKHQVKRIIISNRSAARGQKLAHLVNAEFRPLNTLSQALTQADIVISSTGSVQPVITVDKVKAAQLERPEMKQPWLFIDLAVPRDIESSVAELPNVQLHTVDDLRQIIELNQQQRQQAAQVAEELVHDESEKYQMWYKQQQAGVIVQQLRARAEQTRDHFETLAKQQLQRGVPVETVIASLAYKLTNQLLHLPTKSLQYAAVQQNNEYLQWIEQHLKEY